MQITEKGEIVILKMDGRLDVVNAVTLKEAVKELVDDNRNKLVIDLSDTGFIDSSGCGALVASLRSLVKNNGDMKIANPSVQAKNLFELTRLDRVFEIHSSVGEAVESFKPH
jgi:anti-sigma B factor antagonist